MSIKVDGVAVDTVTKTIFLGVIGQHDLKWKYLVKLNREALITLHYTKENIKTSVSYTLLDYTFNYLCISCFKYIFHMYVYVQT